MLHVPLYIHYTYIVGGSIENIYRLLLYIPILVIDYPFGVYPELLNDTLLIISSEGNLDIINSIFSL